jgi:hypothetical protein
MKDALFVAGAVTVAIGLAFFVGGLVWIIVCMFRRKQAGEPIIRLMFLGIGVKAIGFSLMGSSAGLETLGPLVLLFSLPTLAAGVAIVYAALRYPLALDKF